MGNSELCNQVNQHISDLKKVNQDREVQEKIIKLTQTLNQLKDNQHLFRIACLVQLGHQLSSLNEHSKAIIFLSEARQLSQFYEIKALLVKITYELAKLKKQIQKYDESNRLYQSFISLKKQDGEHSSLDIAAIYNNIGFNHQMKGDVTSALASYLIAEAMAQKLRHPVVTIYKKNIGELYYLRSKDYNKAEHYFNQVIQIEKVRKESNFHNVIECQFYLSGIYFHTGRYLDSMELLLKNLNVESCKNGWKLGEASNWIKSIANKTGLSANIYESALWTAEKHLQGDEIEKVKDSLISKIGGATTQG